VIYAIFFNSKAVLSQWKMRDAAAKIRYLSKYTSRGSPCDSTASCYINDT